MTENGLGNEAEHMLSMNMSKTTIRIILSYLSEINILRHDANKAFLYGVSYASQTGDEDYRDQLEDSLM